MINIFINIIYIYLNKKKVKKLFKNNRLNWLSKTKNIFNILKTKLFIFLVFHPLYGYFSTLILISLVKYYYISVIHADDRTLWQIMNEPLPEGYTEIVIDNQGNKLIYHSDGSKTIKWSIMEIQVNELPSNYSCDCIYCNPKHDSYDESIDSTNNDFINMNADMILNHYFNTVLMTSETKEEIVDKSINYVRILIPSNMWASSPEILKDPHSLINSFLEKLKQSATIDNEDDHLSLIHLVAAISTYNAASLCNVNLELEKDKVAIIFFQAIGSMANN